MDPECEHKVYNNDTPLVPTPLPLGVPSHGQYLDDDNKQSYMGNRHKPEPYSSSSSSKGVQE